MKITIEQLEFPLCVKEKITKIPKISKLYLEFINGKNIHFDKTVASIDIGTQNFTHHDIIYITCERSCVSWEGQIRNMMKIIKRILLSL